MRRSQAPVRLPVERLAPETLTRLVRELVLREDANDDPRGVAERVHAGLAAVHRGEAVLWFHPGDETVTWSSPHAGPGNTSRAQGDLLP